MEVDITDGKRCGTCREVKPRDCFTNSRCERDGLAKRCKACCKLSRERNIAANRAYLADYRARNREKAKQTSAAWRSANPDRAKESSRKCRAKKRPHLSETRKAWVESNREKIRITAKKTYSRHREKYREKNRLHYLKNKPSYRARDRRRRALELQAEGSHTPAQIEALFASQSGLCAVPPCRKPLLPEGPGKYHIDHVLPLSRGGSDDISNISLICPYCNRSKGARTMTEYMDYLVKSQAPAA